VRGRVAPAIALAATLAVSLAIVVAQPVRSVWWTYADADATYTAASLNLLLGEPLHYLDHPGLPLEEVGAGVFAVGEGVGRTVGDTVSTKTYVDGLMLDLDRTRPVFRGIAIASYLAGALLAFVLFARLFGHWGWGLAGGLAWVAAPGLAAMSIQFRPDVPLAVACLVFAYLIGRAVETRSPLLFAGAAFELGIATMVKLHAAALLPALVLGALWRRPADGWWTEFERGLADGVRRHRAWLFPLAGILLALALLLNVRRLPWSPTEAQLTAVLVPIFVVGDYLGLAWLARRFDFPRALRRVLDPFLGFVGAAFLAGLALPMALSIQDGMQALVSIEKGLTGSGVNDTIDPFSASLRQLEHYPLRQATFVFVLAGVGALVALRRREPAPVVWFVGAAMLGVFAEARLAAIHYFAPAFVVALPGAFWLIRQARWGSSLLAAALVAYLVLPQLENRHSLPYDTHLAATVAPSLQAIEARLKPGELAVTPSYWPNGDTRYFGVVEPYVAYTPPYPYRFVSDSARAPELAEDRGLKLRYYTGPLARNLVGEQELMLTEIGPYRVRPVPGVPDAVELLSGPGTGS
jgi:Dolichyl-phosphate-mannose-protein mannosyltransferase